LMEGEKNHIDNPSDGLRRNEINNPSVSRWLTAPFAQGSLLALSVTCGASSPRGRAKGSGGGSLLKCRGGCPHPPAFYKGISALRDDEGIVPYNADSNLGP